MTERAEKTSKPLTNTRRLRHRRANEPLEANRITVNEARDSIYGVSRNLDEAVPVAKYFEHRDLSRTKHLVAALRAGSAANEADRTRVPRCSSGHGDRLATRHLRR
ncbi:MAG: hypothetical protein ACRDIF_02790 [Actinomycetota bacterium]